MVDRCNDIAGEAVTLLPVVAAAMLDGEGRVLLQRRPPGKQMADLWEFPGGKIDPGERPEAALVRELAEELGIVVDQEGCVPLTFASAPLVGRHFLLLLYVIRDWQGDPEALEATELAWVTPAAMHDLPMPPADVPLVAMLERWLTGNDAIGG